MKRVRRLASLDGYSFNLWMFLFLSAVASGQTASLRGKVVDQSGAVIPKATVTLTAASGIVKTTTVSENGSYSFQALPPGPYTVRAVAPKLEQEPVPIVLKPGAQTLQLELKVAAVQQQTTVQENANTSLNTESANNASAVVLRGKDLESLADDPEDLGADLQALAGPGGSSIFIDGFSARTQYELANRVVANMQQRFYFGYVQDDFKVSSRLTLNLGLRYEFATPYYEANNNMANYDPTTNSLVLAKNGSLYDRALWIRM